MDEGADSGDLLSQKRIKIEHEDDAGSLYEKVLVTSLDQIKTFLPQLQSRTYPRIPQDHSTATYWRKRSKKDGIIDFRMSSQSIYNLVRGLSHPYCGALIQIGDQEIETWKSVEVFDIPENIEPGQIIDVNNEKNHVLVKCNPNAIQLDIEPSKTKHFVKGAYII